MIMEDVGLLVGRLGDRGLGEVEVVIDRDVKHIILLLYKLC